MATLSRQSCLNHPVREAVARCPACRHFYCRECVTEHDDRLLCAACLRKLTAGAAKRRNPFRPVARVVLAGFGFMLAALFFYWIGCVLVALPASVHDGTLWEKFEALP